MENPDNTILVFMNDKLKVAIGEPGIAELATSHNCRALKRKENKLSPSDHNYNFASMSPSVILLCDFRTCSIFFVQWKSLRMCQRFYI